MVGANLILHDLARRVLVFCDKTDVQVSQAFLLLLAGSGVLAKMVMVDNPNKMKKEMMSKQLTNEIRDVVSGTNIDTQIS